MARISRQKLAEALSAAGGLFSYAAEALGVSYQNVHQRVGRDPQLQELCKYLAEQRLDLAQWVVEDTMLGEDGRLRIDAAKFELRNRGQRRGYGELGGAGKPVEIVVDLTGVERRDG